jgi:D-alanine-D-alanine ligase
LPAQFSDELVERLREAGEKAHKALNCRHYSIYDIRVNPEGIPYFLEASLYCSFSSTSIITLMHAALGNAPHDLFHTLATRAIKEHADKQESKAKGVKLLGLS